MLIGLSTVEKKQKLREMKWFLKTNGVQKFRNEPFHIMREYKRLKAKLKK